ncbi:protein FAR1-RELATED SEQUENCE 6-like [Ananas comosus]|uniref:Protein FAR1-RELATED SEQUENCE n=1 Tax=Ananas comosus TaxID=4615 RepID=A0A6P5F4V6_ANACO|nr:protein FAR1-RELATED SEQUENCE 6-like [Ananas comosus]XP_020088292.1 protein FAR1-RELATED SEQUENCE 6-like [Ananas comosus]XP_020088293.1 protein FAR1-RELATED SEQUENCE 6-like [Ananas comosus]XP_020088294.1 protein FAR1-RELATED SEQUENCE 6-like [Ananas comosus]XP_020088295.1 protein FAR1-RELATED SEQUENCE 6-like [Ananas comosus]XP_020088297.1 protein FAR1-RELATED SEQUENCE 6-like [Ananas comosus]XP_020088298.1 protein FAR1-RELATED SEQUENCE 6-like [Ananas comosus]
MEEARHDAFGYPSLHEQFREGNDWLGTLNLIKDNPTNKDDDPLVPKLGMIFGSAEEAYQFYMAYGYRTGFGVIKRSCHSIDGVKVRAAFVCCKEGKPKVRPGPKSRRRLVAKTECKAMMVVKDNARKNQWEVDYLELNHNHPCDPEMVRFMKCFRDLPAWQKEHRPFNAKARVAPKRSSMNRASTQDKEYVNRPFAQREFRNEGGKGGKLRLVDGDVEALMKFFDKMQAQNSNFFYSWDMDEEGRLKNVYWADARSRAIYQYFSDVVTFDTVYLVNQYMMPFVAFLGVNNHGQSTLLGCGLLADETIENYVWLFKKWLRCMNDKPPDAIITSHSKVIERSVVEVFPNARHRFCLWHILKELPEMSGRTEDKEVLSLRMKKMVYDTLTPTDFEREWVEMINQYRLGDNQWLMSLFEDRKKWVPAYIKDTFWAGLSTIQRSERLDAFFDGYITPETTIKMFVEQYDDAMKHKFDREAYDDYRSFQHRPQLLSGLQFEEQITNLYTINMIQKFQDQVKQLMHVICSEVSRSGPVITYSVAVLGKERKVEYTVMYNNAEKDVWCICRSFQFKGILCSHALGVLRQELVTIIPNKYILNRWRKDYKRLHASSSSPPQVSRIREMRIYDYLYKHGHQYFADIVEIGATDVDSMEFALSVMKEAREKVLKYEESRGDRTVNGNRASDATQRGNSSADHSVNENIGNGASSKRIANQREKALENSKKKKRGSN